MHFSNYISAKAARGCIRDGPKKITLTPTARKQTREGTIRALEGAGIAVIITPEKGRPRKLSGKNERKVFAMRKAGVSFNKIANLTGVARSTVFDYCKRREGPPVQESEVRALEIKEAHRVFSSILKKGLDGEIGELASRGQNTGDPEEIGDILKEIEIILHC